MWDCSNLSVVVVGLGEMPVGLPCSEGAKGLRKVQSAEPDEDQAYTRNGGILSKSDRPAVARVRFSWPCLLPHQGLVRGQSSC